MKISAEEIEERLKTFKPQLTENKGYLERYTSVKSADKGAILD